MRWLPPAFDAGPVSANRSAHESAEAGVRLEVTEAVLNHTSGSRAGIVGVYQRRNCSGGRRGALDVWARQLEAIVTGASATNVVELATARG